MVIAAASSVRAGAEPSQRSSDAMQGDQRLPHGILHATLVDSMTMSPVLNASARVGAEQKVDCDNAGICHEHIVTGTYHVVLAAPGYNNVDARVVITEGTETAVELRMTRSKKKAKPPGAKDSLPKQPHTQIKRAKSKKTN